QQRRTWKARLTDRNRNCTKLARVLSKRAELYQCPTLLCHCLDKPFDRFRGWKRLAPLVPDLRIASDPFVDDLNCTWENGQSILRWRCAWLGHRNSHRGARQAQ